MLGEGIQAATVQGGLLFSQVIDDQVADRSAGGLVAVDQHGGAALPDREQLGPATALPAARTAPAWRSSRHDTTPSLTDPLPPFPMRLALPAPEYDDGSVPPAPSAGGSGNGHG
jgi:hypothetical protein